MITIIPTGVKIPIITRLKNLGEIHFSIFITFIYLNITKGIWIAKPPMSDLIS
jgi:hypothetical protein